MNTLNRKESAITEHKQILSVFTLLGGLAFILWSLIGAYLEQVHFEIWPLRVGIGIAFMLTGPLLIKRGFSLSLTEWWITGWGCIASAYVFFVSFDQGLHPVWVTGCVLVIIGILNYLTYKPQMITFAGLNLILSLTTFWAPSGTANSNPWSIILNFGTAIFLGSLASQLRNNSLRRLMQMESNLDIIWTTLHDGIVMHAPDGKILALNPSAPRILGLSMDQIMGRSNIDPMWKTYHIDGRPCPPEEHPSSVAQKTGLPVHDFPLKLVKADGSIAWLSISAVPRFESKKSSPTAVVVSIKDVTEQKTQDELIQRQKQSLEIASRLSSLGEMAAGIAHEINTPLAIISARVDLMSRTLRKNPVLLSEIESSVESVRKTVFRIAKIVGSMKSLSRHNEKDSLSNLNVQEIVSDVLAISQDRIRSQGIELIVADIPSVQIECHPGQIGQALLNLLNNSIDAIDKLEKKWIQVRFDLDETTLAISVVDSGPGIPVEIREKILQPFFTTKEVGKGTGLGLSLVQSIADRHHGTLIIDDQCENTCFKLIIAIDQGQSNKKAS